MASSLTAQLRISTEEELHAKLAEAKEELFNLRFQGATGQLESHGRLRAVRKEIARIYTVMRERELGIITLIEDSGEPEDEAPAGVAAGGPLPMTRRPASERERHRRYAETRGYRKGREGLVVSDKMDKTVVVQVEDHVKHPKYGKVLRRTKKYKAHDATNACGVGDRVLLMETRPLSATKRWRVTEILEKAK
jgi:ribosomal protein L29/30S ribosomal protein S17